MDKSKFPPKASTNNVEKKEFNKIITVIDKILAVIKTIFFSHKSQVHRGKCHKMAKTLTKRSGVGWGKWRGME